MNSWHFFVHLFDDCAMRGPWHQTKRQVFYTVERLVSLFLYVYITSRHWIACQQKSLRKNILYFLRWFDSCRRFVPLCFWPGPCISNFFHKTIVNASKKHVNINLKTFYFKVRTGLHSKYGLEDLLYKYGMNVQCLFYYTFLSLVFLWEGVKHDIPNLLSYCALHRCWSYDMGSRTFLWKTLPSL